MEVIFGLPIALGILWVFWPKIERQEYIEANFDEKKQRWEQEHGGKNPKDGESVEVKEEPRGDRKKPDVDRGNMKIFIPVGVDADVREIGGRYRVTVDAQYLEIEES